MARQGISIKLRPCLCERGLGTVSNVCAVPWLIVLFPWYSMQGKGTAASQSGAQGYPGQQQGAYSASLLDADTAPPPPMEQLLEQLQPDPQLELQLGPQEVQVASLRSCFPLLKRIAIVCPLCSSRVYFLSLCFSRPVNPYRASCRSMLRYG